MFTERSNILEPFLIGAMSDSSVNDQARQLMAQVAGPEMQTILDTQYGSDDEATVVLYVPDYAEKPTSVPSEALLTSPQFDQFKAVEGVCKPVAMVMLHLEGQKYTTADVAWPQLVLLKHTFEAATFNAPLRMDYQTRRGQRQWQAVPFNGQPQHIKDLKRIFLEQAHTRFFLTGGETDTF